MSDYRETLEEKLRLHWWNGDDQLIVANAIREALAELDALKSDETPEFITSDGEPTDPEFPEDPVEKAFEEAETHVLVENQDHSWLED